MKKRYHTFKHSLLLSSGLSMLALLTACEVPRLRNPLADPHPKQIIVGERHAPTLNQSSVMPIATPTNGTPQAQNFDYGSTDAVAPAPPPAQSASAPVYGTAPNPGAMSAPMQPAIMGSAAGAPVVVGYGSVRKPIPGNPQLVSNVAVPVPAAKPEPVEHSSFFSRLFGGSSDSKASLDNVASTKTKAVEASSADGSSSQSMPEWAGRWVGKPDSNTKGPMAAEQNAPYPSLSSVPPTPSQFNDIRSERQQNIQELQNQRADAQSEKQGLGGEPSQQQDVTPVAMPARAPVPKPAAAEALPPEGASVPAQTALAPDQQPTPETPRVPRRGIDILTQEQWEALQSARQQQQTTLPATMDNATQMAPYPQQTMVPAVLPHSEPPHRAYFWEGWGGTSERQPTDAVQKNPGAPESAISFPHTPIAKVNVGSQDSVTADVKNYMQQSDYDAVIAAASPAKEDIAHEEASHEEILQAQEVADASSSPANGTVSHSSANNDVQQSAPQQPSFFSRLFEKKTSSDLRTQALEADSSTAEADKIPARSPSVVKDDSLLHQDQKREPKIAEVASQAPGALASTDTGQDKKNIGRKNSSAEANETDKITVLAYKSEPLEPVVTSESISNDTPVSKAVDEDASVSASTQEHKSLFGKEVHSSQGAGIVTKETKESSVEKQESKSISVVGAGVPNAAETKVPAETVAAPVSQPLQEAVAALPANTKPDAVKPSIFTSTHDWLQALVPGASEAVTDTKDQGLSTSLISDAAAAQEMPNAPTTAEVKKPLQAESEILQAETIPDDAASEPLVDSKPLAEVKSAEPVISEQKSDQESVSTPSVATEAPNEPVSEKALVNDNPVNNSKDDVKPLMQDANKDTAVVSSTNNTSELPQLSVNPASATAAVQTNVGDLPSPHILQEVKVMPASRYSARAQSRQQYKEQY